MRITKQQLLRSLSGAALLASAFIGMGADNAYARIAAPNGDAERGCNGGSGCPTPPPVAIVVPPPAVTPPDRPLGCNGGSGCPPVVVAPPTTVTPPTVTPPVAATPPAATPPTANCATPTKPVPRKPISNIHIGIGVTFTAELGTESFGCLGGSISLEGMPVAALNKQADAIASGLRRKADTNAKKAVENASSVIEGNMQTLDKVAASIGTAPAPQAPPEVKTADIGLRGTFKTSAAAPKPNAAAQAKANAKREIAAADRWLKKPAQVATGSDAKEICAPTVRPATGVRVSLNAGFSN